MLPTLKSGQIAAIHPDGSVEFGDIILVKTSDHKTIVKRVIGLPGDLISIINGQVYRNNQALSEEYAILDNSNFGPITVPNGYLFVLGDNRAHSKDSRQIGCISIDFYRSTLMLPE